MAISDKLAKIKRQAASLNTKTDALNATIEHIEQQLRGAGVEFWWHAGPRLGERIERTEDGRERDYFTLGYTKIGSEWCVAVQAWTDVDHAPSGPSSFDDFDSLADGDPVPLTRAPRRIRIATAEHLESFLDALHAELSKMESAVDKANALVSDDEAARTKGGK